MYKEADLAENRYSASSGGVLEKWYDTSSNSFIKASSWLRESKRYHIESVMECIASRIGNLLGVNVVDYHLDTLEKVDKSVITVCVSKNYRVGLGYPDVVPATLVLVDADDNVLPMRSRYDELVKNFPHVRRDIDKMIVFDYLIDNQDRHLKNFEFYTDSNDEVRLAPIYDNGVSLLANAFSDEELEFIKDEEDVYDEHIRFAQTLSKAFRLQHNLELSLVDKSVFNHINMGLSDDAFHKIVSDYEGYLSPLRVEMIVTLLRTRYANLKRFATR